MSEPIETIIIRARQDFGVLGGLNPVQIEIKDDRIINMLKNTKMSSPKEHLQGFFSSSSNKRHKPDFYYCKKIKWSKKKKHIKL